MRQKFIHLFVIFLLGMALVMCKNQEKIHDVSTKTDMSPCAQLTQDSPSDAVLFVTKAESKRKHVAAQRAEQETVIQLVQFFQSEFIEGGQVELFSYAKRMGNNTSEEERIQNEEFRKDWAEMSYEIIGTQHNQNAFTHNQKIVEGSTVYIVYNVLIVPNDWIRDHWERSLAVTDPSFYEKVKQSKYHKEVMEMDIRQQPVCKNL